MLDETDKCINLIKVILAKLSSIYQQLKIISFQLFLLYLQVSQRNFT